MGYESEAGGVIPTGYESELIQTETLPQWDHLEYLKRLIEGEVARREDNETAD
jgi:hypothetical protein